MFRIALAVLFAVFIGCHVHADFRVALVDLEIEGVVYAANLMTDRSNGGVAFVVPKSARFDVGPTLSWGGGSRAYALDGTDLGEVRPPDSLWRFKVNDQEFLVARNQIIFVVENGGRLDVCIAHCDLADYSLDRIRNELIAIRRGLAVETEGHRETAEPGATDNPDDAQRI